MRYYVSDGGGTLTRSGDAITDVFPLPPGYREVTAEEYHQAAGTVLLPSPEQPPAT
ncbi:hypothetical protein [Streptomyces zaomyceticus]|uniref:hypothetical protein n=1 Tax=Streptomyces zaomyceticus TaxID=68286 RepID=UPI0037879C7A